jgi:polysaccharide export outer membrane protein
MEIDMKQHRSRVVRWAGAIASFAILGVAMLLTGCQSDKYSFQEVPGSEVPKTGRAYEYSDKFQVGDLVKITFSGNVANDLLQKPHEEHVKEDGSITPPYVGSAIAAGKKPGVLQKELQDRYDLIFRNLTVTVTAGDRYFHVDGEVNRKGPCPYLAETDIVQAISAAGGFTEFANKKNIRLIHPNGETEIINYNKAVEDPGFNRPVYPADKIVVKRRIF